MKRWEEVFTELTRISIYSCAAPIEEKKRILGLVWEDDVPRLVEQYDPRGIGAKGENGFGFLVEAFAKRSPKLPGNTEAGARLVNLLISALHTGDSMVGTGFKLSNPDLVWVENRGRRSIITGIAEIKSSVEAVSHRFEQLTNFEASLRLLLKKVASDKEKGEAIQYLALKKVTLADPLKKLLVLPAGEGAKAKWLPQGWEVLEIEFSYDELVFIAQRIWPDFRKDLKPAEGYLPRYERELLVRLVEWGKLRFNKIFAKTTLVPFPTREYLLYTFATGELPLADEQVKLAVACVREANSVTSFPPETLGPASLSTWERKFMEYFQLLWGREEKVKQYILHFLHDRRSFAARLQKILRRRDLKAALRKKVHALDLLDT